MKKEWIAFSTFSMSLLGLLVTAPAFSGQTELEPLFKCYWGMHWYAADAPNFAAEALANGPKAVAGEDTPIIVIPGDRPEKESVVRGIYVFTQEEIYFFKFLTMLEPGREYHMALEFPSLEGYPRKIWVKYTEDAKRTPGVLVFSTLVFDSQCLKPSRLDLDDDDRAAHHALALVIARSVTSMKETYMRLRAVAERNKVSPPDVKVFLDHLETCKDVDHAIEAAWIDTNVKLRGFVHK